MTEVTEGVTTFEHAISLLVSGGKLAGITPSDFLSACPEYRAPVSRQRLKEILNATPTAGQHLEKVQLERLVLLLQFYRALDSNGYTGEVYHIAWKVDEVFEFELAQADVTLETMRDLFLAEKMVGFRGPYDDEVMRLYYELLRKKMDQTESRPDLETLRQEPGYRMSVEFRADLEKRIGENTELAADISLEDKTSAWIDSLRRAGQSEKASFWEIVSVTSLEARSLCLQDLFKKFGPFTFEELQLVEQHYRKGCDFTGRRDKTEHSLVGGFAAILRSSDDVKFLMSFPEAYHSGGMGNCNWRFELVPVAVRRLYELQKTSQSA